MKPTNKIFSAILGLNPQIVTESIFAIIDEDPANAPDEVYVLSTAAGIQRSIEKLINEKWLDKVYKHFSLPCPEFDESHCITFCNKQGTPMEDIRSYQDSEDAADIIFDHIANWCEDEHSQLHLSVGGGRKSLDLHGGLAMNICSKPSDSMSQVLVSDPRIENNPDFFFPNQPVKQRLTTRDKEIVDVRDIQVDLVYIDYIRLRERLPKDTFCLGKSRLEIIAMGRRVFESQTLSIDHSACSIIAAGKPIKLAPIDFAFYSWVIDQKLKGAPVANTAYQANANTVQLAIQQIRDFLSYIHSTIEKYRSFASDSENTLTNLLNTLENNNLNHMEKLTHGVRAWAKYKTKQASGSKSAIKAALKVGSLFTPYILQNYDAQGNPIHGSTSKTGIRLDIDIKSEDIEIID